MMIRPVDNERGELTNVAPRTSVSSSSADDMGSQKSDGSASRGRTSGLDFIASGLLASRKDGKASFRKGVKGVSDPSSAGLKKSSSKDDDEDEMSLSDLTKPTPNAPETFGTASTERRSQDDDDEFDDDFFDTDAFHKSLPAIFFQAGGGDGGKGRDRNKEDREDDDDVLETRGAAGARRTGRRGSGVSLPGRGPHGHGRSASSRRRGSGVSLPGGMKPLGILKKTLKYSSNNLAELEAEEQRKQIEEERKGRADRRGSGVSVVSIRSVQFADEIFDDDDDELSLDDLLGALVDGGSDEPDNIEELHKSVGSSNSAGNKIEFDLGDFGARGGGGDVAEDQAGHGSKGSGWGNDSGSGGAADMGVFAGTGLDWAQRLPDMMAFSAAGSSGGDASVPNDTPKTKNGRKNPGEGKKTSNSDSEGNIDLKDRVGGAGRDDDKGIPRELSLDDLQKADGCGWDGNKSSASGLTLEETESLFSLPREGEKNHRRQQNEVKDEGVPSELDILGGGERRGRRPSACSLGDKSCASGLTLEDDDLADLAALAAAAERGDDEEEELSAERPRRPSAISWGDKSTGSGLFLEDDDLAYLGGTVEKSCASGLTLEDDDLADLAAVAATAASSDHTAEEPPERRPRRPSAVSWGDKSSGSGLTLEDDDLDDLAGLAGSKSCASVLTLGDDDLADLAAATAKRTEEQNGEHRQRENNKKKSPSRSSPKASSLSFGEKSSGSGLALEDDDLADLGSAYDEVAKEELSGKVESSTKCEAKKKEEEDELRLDDLGPASFDWGHKSSASGLSLEMEGSFSLLEG